MVQRVKERTGEPMGSGSGRPTDRRQVGFTLLAMLFLVAALGVGLAALGTVWETALRREKEAELLFVGDQYRLALESYYRSTPGQTKHYPRALEDLLSDPRFPNTVRHLRRLYRDPLSNSADWGLVRQGAEITGIHSLSTDKPMKSDGFILTYESFANAVTYRDWVFSISTSNTTAAQSGSTPAGAGKQNINSTPEAKKIAK